MPCVGGGIPKFSHVARSLVSPALQVGKQTDGVTGWRAWDGSAGMAGGFTGGGNKAGDTLLQAATSSVSNDSISTSSQNLAVSLIDDLLVCRLPALFLDSVG